MPSKNCNNYNKATMYNKVSTGDTETNIKKETKTRMRKKGIYFLNFKNRVQKTGKPIFTITIGIIKLQA